MELNLKDKVVIVTGSSKGIGKSIATGFLAEGAKVVISGRNKAVLDKTYSKLLKRYPSKNLLKYRGDLLNLKNIDNCLKLTVSKWKKIDILITNIGSGKPDPASKPKEELKRMLNINYQSAVDIIEKTIPVMKKNAGSSIVCIASIAGVENIGAPDGYQKAKAKLLEYCRKKSLELAKFNIRLNAVSPGNILCKGGRWEELQKTNPKKIKQLIEELVPLKRFGTPEEIADTVLFLASEKSGFTAGSNYIVDGGQIAKMAKH